jgi:hypothetical protein
MVLPILSYLRGYALHAVIRLDLAGHGDLTDYLMEILTGGEFTPSLPTDDADLS